MEEWNVNVVGVGIIGTVHESTEELARCAALSKFGEEGCSLEDVASRLVERSSDVMSILYCTTYEE